MADKITISSGPWPKGVDNRSPDYAVPPDALRNAVDVDLLNDGRVRRRDGYERIVDVFDPHSLWSCPAGTYFVSQNILYQLNADNTTTTILAGLLGRPVAFEYFDGDVYLSDGILTRKLIGGTSVTEWGIRPPTVAPLLTPIAGTMAEGSFLGAISFVTASGEESGLSPIATLTTFATGGVQFSSFPPVTNAAVVSIRLYLSTSGGSTLYRIADVSTSTASYNAADLLDTGREADIIQYDVPPACQIIRHKAGRMYCASGSTVWYTEPLALGRVQLNANFWQFSADVTVLAPVESGIYIAADKTYFYRFKDPAQVEITELFDYGAIPYTTVFLPHDEGVMWQSIRGAIMADENGRANNAQEVYVATPTAASGAALLREKDGLRQFIATLATRNVSILAARDFMEIEVIRRGS